MVNKCSRLFCIWWFCLICMRSMSQDVNVDPDYLSAATSERLRIDGAYEAFGEGPYRLECTFPDGKISATIFLNRKSIYASLEQERIKPRIDPCGIDYHVFQTVDRFYVYEPLTRSLFDHPISIARLGKYEEMCLVMPVFWSSVAGTSIETLFRKHDSTIERTDGKTVINSNLKHADGKLNGLKTSLQLTDDYYPTSFQWLLGNDEQEERWEWDNYKAKRFLKAYVRTNGESKEIRRKFVVTPIDDEKARMERIESKEDFFKLFSDAAIHYSFGPDKKQISEKQLGNPASFADDLKRARYVERTKFEKKAAEKKRK
jgi:hypothetical protein